MRILTLLLIVIALSPFSSEGKSPRTLAEKAQSFYADGEWASASAMIELLLEEHPSNAALYGRGIVAAEMQGDSNAPLQLIERAIDNHVSFDSVFSRVRSESFQLGKTNLYENFLLSVKSHIPWLSRSVDSYLLDYYSFRRDGENMIVYSKIMLGGLPESVPFLSTLAQGYLLTGKTAEGMDVYEEILRLDPRNYDALLYLGNYFFTLSEADPADSSLNLKAKDFLTRAAQIQNTPFVDRMIAELTPRKRHK